MTRLRTLLTSTALAFAFLSDATAAPARSVQDTAVESGTPITKASAHYKEAQGCLSAVATARAWAGAELGYDVRWVNEPVSCEVAADTGCGSAMSGHELEFLTGEPGHCAQAALIPAYVFHEWAHGLNHEFAGVRSQTLDEALADTFAIYLTGNPRFGQGMFFDRETSWQRDLSDRKTYDGETKQLYTQSETLSGAWWDFRVRLVSELGNEAGAALAKKVFFRHLRELSGAGTAPAFIENYEFARSAVENLPALATDRAQRARVACALTNSFLDHGFAAPLEPGCVRAPLVSDGEKILAELAAGARVTTAVPTAIPGHAFPVALSGQQTLRFDLKAAGPRTSGVSGKVRALIVRMRIDYPFPDDLMLRVTAPDGTRHELYKGEEELAIPTVVTDRYRFAGARAAGTWLVDVISLGKGFAGEVRALELSLLTN